LNETRRLADVGTLDAPPIDCKSINDVLKETYKHECFITGKINQLAKIAQEEDDFSTFNFLQWYVAEQHEEEKLVKSIIDKIEMIGPNGLFFIDKEVEKMAGVATGIEEV